MYIITDFKVKEQKKVNSSYGSERLYEVKE